MSESGIRFLFLWFLFCFIKNIENATLGGNLEPPFVKMNSYRVIYVYISSSAAPARIGGKKLKKISKVMQRSQIFHSFAASFCEMNVCSLPKF